MLKKPYKSINGCNIYGNNHLIPLIYGYELSDSEKLEFDYLNNEDGIFQEDDFTGFRYKGNIYDLGEFMRIDSPVLFDGLFDGIHHETYFSGILIKLNEDDSDFIKAYTYCG